MNDEVVTVVETQYCTVELGSMWRIKLSNRLTVWIGMAEEIVPKVGTEMLVIYPNEHEVILHLPVYGRIVPFTVKRDMFFMDMYELEADYYLSKLG
jgi:hypothetical protein